MTASAAPTEPSRPPIRRLDHVAIGVRDTAFALQYFRDTLGLPVVHTDVLDEPAVILTYLDAGNAYLQLVEPRPANVELAEWLDRNGEGLHHICFAVDDVAETIDYYSDPALPHQPLGSGRGRVAGFIANGLVHGVRVECTEFRPGDE